MEGLESGSLKEPGGRRWKGCAAVLEGPEVQVKDAGGGLSRLERLPLEGLQRGSCRIVGPGEWRGPRYR